MEDQLKSLRLLQISDVHYPDVCESLNVDRKDEAFPVSLLEASVSNQLQSAVRKILSVCAEKAVSGILVCGDLTSQGNLKSYRECAKYLVSSLGLGQQGGWPFDSVHVVPGNHDVDRDQADPQGRDLLQKFQPLQSVWHGLAAPILPVEGVRHSLVSEENCTVHVSSLNSCVGCGERRSLPQSIRDQLQRLLSEYAERVPPESAFQVIGEQLDTPAFLEEHVAELVQRIAALGPECLAVAVAHHNLLPQAQVRIDIYTEVINGGLLRSRLASCGRPVLYCHGHIHQDPIEIIQNARAPCGRVVSISAPELVAGFNLIEVFFARSGLPAGCEVTPYRVGDAKEIQETPALRVPLVAPRDAQRIAEGNDVLAALLLVLGANYRRFRDVLQAVREQANTRHQERTVAGAIMEAEWLGLAAINDREEEFRHWSIRKSGP